jgi:hypothetical protein
VGAYGRNVGMVVNNLTGSQEERFLHYILSPYFQFYIISLKDQGVEGRIPLK